LDADIEQLIGLQECDSNIQAIQTKKAEGPARIEELKQGLNEIETRLNQTLERLEEHKRERRESEQRIEDIDAKVAHSNQKLDSIKSNKEYRAALKEIRELGGEKSKLEDRVLDVMESIDEQVKACDAAKAESEAAGKRFEADCMRIMQELESLDQDLKRHVEMRAELSGRLDGNMLRLYDSLRKNKGGIAISAVVKGVCQTCHLRIPPQQFIELIRGEKRMNCPHCRRIIYWGEEDKTQPENSSDEKAGMSE
jgi:predicted  nucleic acid-binding Zn-ribbon protein